MSPAVDAADKESCRPDFAVAIYPGHLSLADNSFALNPDIRTHITRQTPPTFLLQNEDDESDRVEDSLSYYAAKKEGWGSRGDAPSAHGGHAFGLRRTKFPATAWPQPVKTWLGNDRNDFEVDALLCVLSSCHVPVGKRSSHEGDDVCFACVDGNKQEQR